MNLTFEELRYANVQRNKEWDPDNQITGSFRGLELAGEVGELCNMVKKLERLRLGLQGSRVDLLDVAYELADCQITLDLLAMHYNIDLGVMTTQKFNQTSEKLGWKTMIDDTPQHAFFVCNDCSTTDMCTQESHCDRTCNGCR